MIPQGEGRLEPLFFAKDEPIHTPEVIEPEPVVSAAVPHNSPLRVFEAHGWTIRTVYKDDKPWFVAKDVAEALGYKDAYGAIKKHCKCAELLKTVDLAVLGNFEIPPRGLQIIPRGDIYRLISRSQLPELERFESWMFDEVFPTIEDKGSYSLPAANVPALPQNYVEALEALTQQVKENMVVAEERDEAIRTKAQIGDRKVATAMSKASKAIHDYPNTTLRLAFLATTQGKLTKPIQVMTMGGGILMRYWCLHRFCNVLLTKNRYEKKITFFSPLRRGKITW